jgi:predicted unusual protein kinase regulating ubiquinone biosynthesis (AarF/ABC1/UbiB family)
MGGPDHDNALDRIDLLIQVGLRLALSATNGRVLLARIATAIDPVWIPRPWGDTIAIELETARTAACEPVDMRRIERVLRDAWGCRPADELDQLDRVPVAVTPTSQVHRGVLDGAAVAVKVLRPGLQASVRQDLALLEGLRRPLGAAFPALDTGAVLREFRERVLEELDLENEAWVQRRFHRALRNHPFLTVPAPVTRLSHHSVLVSEWVDGVPLHSAQDSVTAAARLLVFVLGSARAGTIYADADPDDVLVLADGRLAILDYGATRTVDPGRVDAAAAALQGFINRDADSFGSALEQLGWLPSSHAGGALELAREALGELAGPDPARLDSEAVLAACDRLLSRPDALAKLILAGAPPAADLWPALAVAQLFGTIARVGVTGPWRELTQRALRDGWSTTADP